MRICPGPPKSDADSKQPLYDIALIALSSTGLRLYMTPGLEHDGTISVDNLRVKHYTPSPTPDLLSKQLERHRVRPQGFKVCTVCR